MRLVCKTLQCLGVNSTRGSDGGRPHLRALPYSVHAGADNICGALLVKRVGCDQGAAGGSTASARAAGEGLVALEAAGPHAVALLADALKGALPHASGELQVSRGSARQRMSRKLPADTPLKMSC